MIVFELIKLLEKQDQFAEVWFNSGHHIGQIRDVVQGRNWKDRPTNNIVWVK